MVDDLLKAANAARSNAHAPYSHFSVGAAIRTKSGNIYAGTNFENASFPHGWCAETSAIAVMVSAEPPGSGRLIAEVCVVADKIKGRITTPCGGCRQRLAEFGDADTVVHAVAPDGDRQTYRLADLLPAAFKMDGDE
jgi:cytidine deaminase